MTISKPAAAAALCLLLIACSKGGGGGGSAASSAGPAPAPAGGQAAAPASAPDTAINPADLPRQKAGYWERVESSDGGAPSTSHFCSSGKAISPQAQMSKGCSKLSFKRSITGSVVIDAACAQGPASSEMHMVVSGDFNSHYVTDAKATIAMQGQPPHSFTSHTETRYLGPCPSGETPED